MIVYGDFAAEGVADTPVGPDPQMEFLVPYSESARVRAGHLSACLKDTCGAMIQAMALADVTIRVARAEQDGGLHRLCLLVDPDLLGGTGRTVDFLLDLRQAHPACRVVLASHGFRGHDFGTHRLPLCDASLALPAQEGELAIALWAADRNNAHWVERRMAQMG